MNKKLKKIITTTFLATMCIALQADRVITIEDGIIKSDEVI